MRVVAFLSALAAGVALFPAAAAAAPSPVSAWYVYGSSPAAVASYAYARGCDFAESEPGGGLRLMLLDFGAARKLGSSTWGTVDFSNTTVANTDILAALEAAADGYHNCHEVAALQRHVSIATTDSSTEPAPPPDSVPQPIPRGCSARGCLSRSLHRSWGCGTAGS